MAKGLPAHLCLDELPGQVGELRVDAVEVDNPQVCEQRLVELPPHFVTGVPVELVRVRQEVEPAANVCRSLREVVLNGRQAGLDVASFDFDVADTGSGLRGGEATFGDEIDEVVRFDGQLLQVLRELVAEKSLRAQLVFKRVVDRVAHPLDELGFQSHGAVVLDDRFLDFMDR